MKSELESLRRVLADPLPHPDPSEIRGHADQIIQWLLEHHTSLSEQPIGAILSRPDAESLLGESAPRDGREFQEILREFGEKVAPNSFRVNHPRFFAFIPGAPSWYSILGDMLCAGTNFFAGVWLEGSGPAQVELTVLRWFREWLEMPETTAGILTSGGSEANLIALTVARERLRFEDRARTVLYVTEQRHGSMDRAANIIGLRPDQIHPIVVDRRFRLDPQALRATIETDAAAGLLPWALSVNAGATNTGAIDPLIACANICRDHGVWLHVDAAYGWPAVLVESEREAMAGIGRADSVTLDPHKWFGQTFEAGCVLVREGKLLPQTFTNHPDYLQDVLPAEDEVNFADYGIALTRRFRALKIWLSVKVHGMRWYQDLVTRCCRLAEFVQGLLKESGRFEIMCSRQLSIVCFRYVPHGPLPDDIELDRMNLVLVEALQRTGRAFLSSTRLDGRVALRFCFVNWRTTAKDVEETVALLLNLAGK